MQVARPRARRKAALSRADLRKRRTVARDGDRLPEDEPPTGGTGEAVIGRPRRGARDGIGGPHERGPTSHPASMSSPGGGPRRGDFGIISRDRPHERTQPTAATQRKFSRRCEVSPPLGPYSGCRCEIAIRGEGFHPPDQAPARSRTRLTCMGLLAAPGDVAGEPVELGGCHPLRGRLGPTAGGAAPRPATDECGATGLRSGRRVEGRGDSSAGPGDGVSRRRRAHHVGGGRPTARGT